MLHARLCSDTSGIIAGCAVVRLYVTTRYQERTGRTENSDHTNVQDAPNSSSYRAEVANGYRIMSVFRRFLYHLGYLARETGQALDRAGCFLQGNFAYREALYLSRHRQIMNLVDRKPIISPQVQFIAPNAAIIGDVAIGAASSVWYGAVIRGDVNKVVIGERTNVQDRAVIHVASGGGKLERALPTFIGNEVTIGHGAILHACAVEDQAVVGMGAIVLDGSRVESGAVIGAGSVLPPGTVVGAGQLWLGTPARFVRLVSAEEKQQFAVQCSQYVELAKMHATECGKTPDQLDAEQMAALLWEERSEDYLSSLGLLGKEEDVMAAQKAYLAHERQLAASGAPKGSGKPETKISSSTDARQQVSAGH
jgi:carbonic anhydrase/acetyltransferase-like protein (isoleucine patch superfamily)